MTQAQEELFHCMKFLCAFAGGYLEPSQIGSLYFILENSEKPEFIESAFELHAEKALELVCATNPKAKKILVRILQSLEDKNLFQ